MIVASFFYFTLAVEKAKFLEALTQWPVDRLAHI
jgi:hypothetical protein